MGDMKKKTKRAGDFHPGKFYQSKLWIMKHGTLLTYSQYYKENVKQILDCAPAC